MSAVPRKVRIVREHSVVATDPPSKTTRLTARRWKGVLKDIPDLPVDILYEIFSHLSPLDLLNISRSCKTLRAFVLNRNASGTWRSARGNVDCLPDCPPYLSEPAYANLMFSPHCHSCFTGNVHNVIWPFLVRYCNSCKKEESVESYLLGGRGGFANGLTEDMFCKSFGDRRRVIYHKPEVELIWEDWVALPNDHDARELFKQAHRERVRQVMQHSALCDKFMESKRTSRSQELEEQKKHKVKKIVERLDQLGWGAELRDMEQGGYRSIAEHVSVRQLKKINDKSWSEIKQVMIDVMSTHRKTRLKDQRRRQLRERLGWVVEVLREHHPSLRTMASDYQPAVVDFAMMPEFRQIAEAPSSTEVTRNNFTTLKKEIPALAERWQIHVNMQLSQALSNGSDSTDCMALSLATTFFDCTSCRRTAMAFPAVVAHDCLYSRYYRSLDTDDSGHFYSHLVFSAYSRPWSCHPLIVSPASVRAKEIIKACGKDPKTTSRRDMNSLSARLCCLTCSRDGVKLVMEWQAAVDHSQLVHSIIGEEDARWEKITSHEAAEVKRIEADYLDDSFEVHLPRMQWSCARCTDMYSQKMSLPRVADHVRIVHHIQNPTAAAGDIYVSGDSPPFVHRPVLLVSDKLNYSDLTPTEKRHWKEGGCLWDFARGRKSGKVLIPTD